MKKLLSLFFAILYMSILLTACSEGDAVKNNNYGPEELEKDFVDNYYDIFKNGDSDENIIISEQSHIETFYCYERYNVKCYEAYLESEPDIKFRVWAEGDEPYTRCQSDFEYIYLKHYLEEYISQNPSASHLKIVPVAGYSGHFSCEVVSELTEDTRAADIESRIADVTGFATYVKNSKYSFYPFLYFDEISDLARTFYFGVQITDDYMEKIPYSCFNGHNYSSMPEFFHAGLSVWISKNRVLDDFYTPEEKESYIAKYNSYSNEKREKLYGSWNLETQGYPVGKYRVYDKRKNFILECDDDYVDVYNKHLSIPQLYDILEAVDWDGLEGTRYDFSFIGLDKEKIHIYPRKQDTAGCLYSTVDEYRVFCFTRGNDNYEYGAQFDNERLGYYVGISIEASNPIRK